MIERLLLALADGEPIPEAANPDDADPSISAQLRTLASLRDTFRARARRAVDSERECPFEWGRLHAVEAIGEGQFGRIFRAHDPVLDRDVALKLFHDSKASAALIEEARQHARVRHPNVLTIHGADVCDGIAGLWMDLLTGQTLADAVRGTEPMNTGRLSKLARDLAQGLEAVHQEGIVHGDLKPANVWLDQRGRSILMDFGAAESHDAERPVRYGSPVTMAPELFDQRPATQASDIYALGAILYFAATGQYPMGGDSLGEIRRAHHDRRPIDTDLLEQAVGKDFAALILEMLAENPETRALPQQILERLREIETAPERRFRRLAVGAIIGSLALGLIASLWFLRESQQAEAEATHQLARAEEFSSLLRQVIDQPRSSEAGSQVTIAEGLRALQARIDTALVDDPLGRAKLLTHLGHTARQVQDLELAARWLDEAMEIYATQGVAGEDARYARRVRASIAAQNEQLEMATALMEPAASRIADGKHITESDLLDAFALVGILSQQHGTDAVAIAERAHALALDTLPDSTRSILQSFSSLARAQMTSGQISQAQNTLEEAIQWAAAREVPAQNDRLGILHEHRAELFIDTGNFAAAEAIVRSQLALRREWLGEDHHDTFRMENMLGILLYNQGRYEEAVAHYAPLYEHVKEHPVMGERAQWDIAANFANSLKEIGEPERALAIYTSNRERLAAEPSDMRYLMMSNNIAETLIDLARWDEALEEATKAVDADIKFLGEEHPFTNHARMMQGAAMAELGDATGAEIIELAAAQLATALGQQSPLYLQSQVKLAKAHIALGQTEQANRVVEKALPLCQSVLGEDHAYTRRLQALAATNSDVALQ